MIITRYYQKVLLDRLNAKSPLIQILIGARQVGKSTAAQTIFDSWEGPKHFVTADSPTPPPAQWIGWEWEKARRLGNGVLIIIDEVQKVPGWSEEIKRLFDPERGKGTVKVLLLGSSSLGLSRGVSESLAGRFELVPAPQWTFAECKTAFGWDFDTFLKYGAYPGAAEFAGDDERWRNYILNSIIEPVLGRDVLIQRTVAKPALFRQTFEMAVQYPAHIISLQKMLGQLQDRGNATTMKHYLDLLKQCFLILPLQKFSGSLIQTKQSSPKIIVLNHALTHAYVNFNRINVDPGWYGFLFESILGAHLAQIPNAELFYWREGNHEIDFVLKRQDEIFAIEVKSGLRKKAGGALSFSNRFPKARVEVWDFTRAIEFMETGKL